MAGIPSLGGPPLIISANGTECLEKSALGNSFCQSSGGSFAPALETNEASKNTMSNNNREQQDIASTKILIRDI